MCYYFFFDSATCYFSRKYQQNSTNTTIYDPHIYKTMIPTNTTSFSLIFHPVSQNRCQTPPKQNVKNHNGPVSQRTCQGTDSCRRRSLTRPQAVDLRGSPSHALETPTFLGTKKRRSMNQLEVLFDSFCWLFS